MESGSISNLREELLDLLFPAYCIGCDAPGKVVCRRCLSGLVQSGPLEEAPPLRENGSPLSFNGVRAACAYGGLAREMILRLKSSGRPLATPLSVLMLAAAGNDPSFLAPDCVCFVPSQPGSVAQRGFNPAEMLARLVSRSLGRPLCDCLAKSRATPDQDSVSAVERWTNVAGTFGAMGSLRPGDRVLLVDDVLTTGATADACAGALLRAGAASIHVLVAARAVLRHGGHRG